MAMTNDLRRLIISRLNDIKTTYGISEIGYRQVQDDNLFPHLVVDFTSMTPTDIGREDYLVDVHIWSKDNEVAFNIQDDIRTMFRFWNAPNEYVDQVILPTFYEMSAGQIEDTDKTICHLVLRAQAQVFKRTETSNSILWQERPDQTEPEGTGEE